MNNYSAGNACSLWMGDLEPHMDEQHLITLYEGLGFRVNSVRLIKDRVTGRPLGYCFLEFDSEQMAQQALTTLNLKQWPGTEKLLKLNWASSSNKGTSRGEEHSVYVGDLSHEVDDNQLFKFFATALGSCKSAKVVTDPGSGQSKGFGFVRFTSDEDAKRAINTFNLVGGLGSNRIRVCKAFPKQGDRNVGDGADQGGFNSGSGDAWQQFSTNVNNYNNSVQQYQQQYSEQTEVEPYDQGLTVEQMNKEYLDYDREFAELFDSTRWQYTDNISATKPVDQAA